MLYMSDLVIYDRQTESLWPQITGQAVVGDLNGKKLTFVPSSIVSFGEWKAAFPQGKVLSRKTGYFRSYGRNPYVGYDAVGQAPFLYSDPLDPRLRPMERVVTVEVKGIHKAYPFTLLRKKRIVEDNLGGKRIVIFYTTGTASATDAEQIQDSRDIGATGVFVPEAGGKRLTFEAAGEGIRDRETGSLWNVLGHAVEGPLAGKRLPPLVHGNHFWFAQAAFRPDTIVYKEAQ